MTLTTPAVSVIVPAYRVTEFIAETLDSVFSQTYRNFEVIVVNDGCPDSEALETVLRPYMDRIVYVKKSNGGLASARNAGIKVAKGPLVALLDGDDTWTPNYLEVQVGALNQDATADIVYPNGTYFGETPLADREIMEFSPSSGAVTFESLVTQRCAVVVSVTGRKEIFLRVNGFDESLRRVEDFDLWLRIVKAGGRIIYHRTPVFRYRRRESSLSANAVAMRSTGLEVLQKIEKTCALSPSEAAALRLAIREFQTDVAYYTGKDALARGDMPSALSAFEAVANERRTVKNRLLVALLRHAPILVRKISAQRVRH